MKTKNRIWHYPFIIMGLLLILTNGCKKDEEPADKITDKDGNVYTSVTIGTQVWMVGNLKTTKYNDGTDIPLVTEAWADLAYNKTPGYCWYDNDIAHKADYGAIYNWYAVITGKLCPTGWHVPSDAEWTILYNFLGGYDVAGNKLKEKGNAHWEAPYNTEATNETGFTALPSGSRSLDVFHYLGERGYYWSSTDIPEETYDNVWYWGMYSNGGDLSRLHGAYYSVKSVGFVVRCLKN